MPPTALFATLVHLAETGHVLAAISAGGVEPTLEDLTGGAHLRVRYPGTDDFVNVPLEVLQATRVSVNDDVLDRPQHYVVGAGNTPVVPGPAPVIGSYDPGPAQQTVVVVWQDGDDATAATGTLDDAGEPPSAAPPGATHWLVAYAGGPLFLLGVP